MRLKVHLLVRRMKYFRRGGHEFRKPSDTERRQTKEVMTLAACAGSAFVPRSGSCRKRRTTYITRWEITVSIHLPAGLADAIHVMRCSEGERFWSGPPRS